MFDAHPQIYDLGKPLNMKTMTPLFPHYELISALADSQLAGDSLEEALHEMAVDDRAIASWRDIHVIGDALRAPASACGGAQFERADLAFLDRFNQRLASYQPEGVWVVARTAALATASELGVVGSLNPPANDRWFGWKFAVGFATVAAVSVMVWTSLAGQDIAMPTQLATVSAPVQVLVASPQGVIVRDARLNELLAAHKQLGAGSALQASSGFLQSAAFETTPASDL